MDRFKWTPEIVDSLDFAETQGIIHTLQNADIAHAHNQRQAQKRASNRR